MKGFLLSLVVLGSLAVCSMTPDCAEAGGGGRVRIVQRQRFFGGGGHHVGVGFVAAPFYAAPVAGLAPVYSAPAYVPQAAPCGVGYGAAVAAPVYGVGGGGCGAFFPGNAVRGGY